MPRAVRSVKLDTRTARSRLPARRAPYFVRIGDKLQLGYFRGVKGGTWIGRRYLGAGSYRTEAIGSADDLREADGHTIFTFDQAQDQAKRWDHEERLAARGIARRPDLTVADVITGYLDHLRAAKGARAAATARSSATARILPQLGSRRVADLTPKLLSEWQVALATAPKLVRTKATASERATRAVVTSTEAERKRKATANRITTVLKAALNWAYQSGQVPSDEGWRRLKPFRNVDAPKVRYLSDVEARRLVAACDPAFRPLVTAALLTGCRYGELCRLQVRDVELGARRLFVREAKSGRPRHVVITDEAVDLLAPLIAGRPSSALVFARRSGGGWKASQQQRPMEAASRQAGLDPSVTFHDLRNTYAARLAMRGVPMAVIAAQLGHADTRITERHYAHLAPSFVADTIHAQFGALLTGT